MSDQGHDAQVVAGVALVVFGGRVAAGGRRAGRGQRLGGGRGGQSPRSQGHVESVHTAAVDAGLEFVGAQLGGFSLHLDHPAEKSQLDQCSVFRAVSVFILLFFFWLVKI